MRSLLTLLLLASAVCAAEPEASPSPTAKQHRIIPTVEGHIIASHVFPRYPAEAKAKGWVGEGVITLYVRANGTVYDAKVFKSTGYDMLDQEAIRAFRQWHFRPEKTDFTTKVPCDFRITATPTPSVTPTI